METLKKIIGLITVIITVINISVPAVFAETNQGAQEKAFEENKKTLQNSLVNIPTTPTINNSESPEGYKSTQVTDLFHANFGNIDAASPSVKSNMPDDSYFQSKINTMKNTQSQVDAAKIAGAANIEREKENPWSNPFAVDITAMAASDRSLALQMKADNENSIAAKTEANNAKISSISDANNTKQAQLYNSYSSTYKSASDVGKSSAAAGKATMNSMMNEYNKMKNDVQSSINQGNQLYQSQTSGLNSFQQGLNNMTGSYINPFSTGNYIQDKYAESQQKSLLEQKAKNGTITNAEKSQLNSLQNQFSLKGWLNDAGSYIKFMFTGKK